MDIDYLSTRIIQCGVEYIAEPLTDIINTCFEEGVVPEYMKMAKVTPIFKKGSPTECSNYRPISVLPVFSKVLEAAVLARLVSFLDAHQILSPQQYGFRRGRSTTDAVQALLDFVWEAAEEGEDVHATMCDLSKAFDTLKHDILLEKLEHYGIRGKPHQLFESYFRNRRQAVFTEGALGTFMINGAGVAQGSLLGPLAFCLYINDLPASVTGNIILYAYDTTLLTRQRDPGGHTHRISSITRKCKNVVYLKRLNAECAKDQ